MTVKKNEYEIEIVLTVQAHSIEDARLFAQYIMDLKLDRWAMSVDKAEARAKKTPEAEEQAKKTPEGSRCYTLGQFKVAHWDCDMYPDGTITDVRTGKVVSYK